MPPARVSIKDVAVRAGVSLGTVSNVLNRPSIVGEDTRERVQRVIREIGYVRNESARQLRAGSSRTIAYVVLDASNPFFTDVASGAELAAVAADVGLYLCNSGQDPEREQRYLELLVEQRVRGVLITPVDPDGEGLARLGECGVPVVMVDRHAGPLTCSVSVDDVAGGRLAGEHLFALGHRSLAYVGGPRSLPQVRDRWDGTAAALAAAGLPPEALLDVPTVSCTVAEGRKAGALLASMPPAERPTAAFCANDLLALGLLQEMTRRGLDVPGDMAIVGYDDIEFAEAAAVPLTSVHQPRELLGRTGAELLLEEAKGEEGHVHQQVQFQPELVVRASTAGFPAGGCQVPPR